MALSTQNEKILHFQGFPRLWPPPKTSVIQNLLRRRPAP